MTYLLDTHLLVWWLANDGALPQRARQLISEGANAIFVSAVSAWEMEIKKSIGKLETPENLEEALGFNHFRALPISIRHAILAAKLPLLHKDPFDRMLIAQAQSEGLTLLTHDRRLKPYGSFVSLV